MPCSNCGKASAALFCVACRKSAVGSLEQAKKSKAPKSPCGGCGKEFKIETLKNGAGYCARCLAKGKPSASSSKSTKSKKSASHANGGDEEPIDE